METRPLILMLVAMLIMTAGCVTHKQDNTTPEQNMTLRIATWNIENFGKAKAGNPETMRAISDELKQFDVIAIQEVSNLYEQNDEGCPRNEHACPSNENCFIIRFALEKYLNKDNGLQYDFIFSPYVKDERYLFVYNTKTVELMSTELVRDPAENTSACMQDSAGLMLRQPFVGRFRSGNFTFTLMTAHTSPSNNFLELQRLELMMQDYINESNLILLGDLNADCDYLKADDAPRLREERYFWLPPDGVDTTTGKTKCTYDRFIFTNETQSRFTERMGTDDVSPEVSDHKLVWAEFRTD